MHRLQIALMTISLVAAQAIQGVAAEAQAPAARRESDRRGPLAALPSAPGGHIEKIKALGDNAWLNLGSPAPDPKWGKARGRSYSPKMAFAPDLRGAFLFGEGPHAHARMQNLQTDLFFYDINAHAWICCFPPPKLATLKLQVDAKGFEVDDAGQPVPYSTSHGWNNIDYDTAQRRFVSVHCPCTYSMAATKDQREQWRGGAKTADMAHPWFWDVATGRWERCLATGELPKLGWGKTLHYVPALKQSVYFGAEGLYRFDHASNQWENCKTPRPPLGWTEAQSCYDAKRQRIYLGGGYGPEAKDENSLCAYDIKANAWIDLKAANGWAKRYSTSSGTMTYDSANDVVVVLYQSKELHVYDPAANAWNARPIKGPPNKGGVGYPSWNAFYDPELKVHFFHVATDGRDNGVVWVYRYRRHGA